MVGLEDIWLSDEEEIFSLKLMMILKLFVVCLESHITQVHDI